MIALVPVVVKYGWVGGYSVFFIQNLLLMFLILQQHYKQN